MNNRIKLFGIIAIVAIIGFTMASCDGGPLSSAHTHDPNWETGLCTNCGALMYSLGDTGPGGGIIFYRSAIAFGAGSGGSWHYLEGARVNQSTGTKWSSVTGVDVTGAREKGIGWGKANTMAIIAAHPADALIDNAAKTAVAYNGGGRNDWFLPSINELLEMRKERARFNELEGDIWSSTQQSNNYQAYAWNYSSTSSTGGPDVWPTKTNSNTVRAIRAF